MKKGLIITLIVALLLVVMAPAVSAEGYTSVPYSTYQYWNIDEEREAVEIRQVYAPVAKLSGADLGIEDFTMPSDMDCDEQGNLYILDADNSRVVVVAEDLTLKAVLAAPVAEDGTELDFGGAEGIYIKEDGSIYIADTMNQRVLVLNNDGSLKQIITIPDASVIPEDFNYAPTKVLTDSRDYVYVLSSGSYYGALVYSDAGEFLGFYGANTVESSVVDALGKLWDRLTMTEAKRAASLQKLPFQFISMDIDDEDFIYTLTGLTDNLWDVGVGHIRRLNPAGNSIMKNSDGEKSDTLSFADTGSYNDDANHPVLTSFQKLCVDNDGFIYAIDTTYGHVFVYDNMCNSFAVFGGGYSEGDQVGTFVRPESVAVSGDKVYVLDSLDSSFTVFTLTEYGKLYKQAQSMTLSGQYSESVGIWNQVLALDKNNRLAYRGLTQAALLENDYKAALEYARLGYDQTDYAVAFAQIRGEILAENMWWIVSVAIVAIIGLVALLIIRKRRAPVEEYGVAVKKGPVSFALGTITHPFDSFYRLKNKGEGSALVALIILALFYVSTVLCDIYSGFSFSIFNPSTYNSLKTLLSTVGLVLLFAIVNWGVCVLAQGKGKLKEIFMVTCYALIPEIIASAISLILTNVLVPEEAAILSIITTICHILFGIVLCVGIMAIHEYDFFRFLWTTILTVLGMLLIVFIIFMVFILFQELFGFIGSLYTEIFYR